MKPVNELAFKNICEDFSCKCMGYCSEATYITLEEIAHDCDPYTYDEEDAKNNFLENIVLKIYSLVMTKEGFQEYVGEYLEMAIELRLNPQDWGDTEDIDIDDFNCPIENITYEMIVNAKGYKVDVNKEDIGINYDDFDSFLEDIDYSFLNKNLSRCWDRACITDQPFSEDEIIKMLTSD